MHAPRRRSGARCSPQADCNTAVLDHGIVRADTHFPMSAPLATCILAAGLGTRMKSAHAKVLHRVAGRPMIEYPVALAHALGSERVVCVLGHQAAEVQAAVEDRFGAGQI